VAAGSRLRPPEPHQRLREYHARGNAVDHRHRHLGLHFVDQPRQRRTGHHDALGVILLDKLARKLRGRRDQIGRIGEILRPHVEWPVSRHADREPGPLHHAAIDVQHPPHRADESDRPAEQRRCMQRRLRHADDRKRCCLSGPVERGVERYGDQRGVGRSGVFGQKFDHRSTGERIFSPRADHPGTAAGRQRHDFGARTGNRARRRRASLGDGFGRIPIDQ
jgi:hypothetical protein